MAEYARPGQVLEWTFDFFGDSGLAGTLGVRILDNEGGTTTPRFTDGITELGAGIYVARVTAPDSDGTYTLWADRTDVDPDDAEDGDVVADSLFVSASGAPAVVLPDGRDLCTYADVISYVPAYRPNDTVDALLARFITSVSNAFERTTGREIALGTAPATHAVTVTDPTTVSVGDLSDTDGITITAINTDGTTIGTFDEDDVTPLYGDDQALHRRHEWDPVTALEFATGALAGATRLRITGTWGFPTIPTFVRDAVAGEVVVNYISRVSNKGTSFSDVVDGINLAELARTYEEAIELLRTVVVA